MTFSPVNDAVASGRCAERGGWIVRRKKGAGPRGCLPVAPWLPVALIGDPAVSLDGQF
jgi:hypothetical protein